MFQKNTCIIFYYLRTIKKSSVCIDCSTIDIEASKKIAALCEQQSVHFNDAPVSGGVIGAEKATLTFMVGSKSKADFERIKPILEAMGKNIVLAGDLGHGLVSTYTNYMIEIKYMLH